MGEARQTQIKATIETTLFLKTIPFAPTEKLIKY